MAGISREAQRYKDLQLLHVPGLATATSRAPHSKAASLAATAKGQPLGTMKAAAYPAAAQTETTLRETNTPHSEPKTSRGFTKTNSNGETTPPPEFAPQSVIDHHVQVEAEAKIEEVTKAVYTEKQQTDDKISASTQLEKTGMAAFASRWADADAGRGGSSGSSGERGSSSSSSSDFMTALNNIFYNGNTLRSEDKAWQAWVNSGYGTGTIKGTNFKSHDVFKGSFFAEKTYKDEPGRKQLAVEMYVAAQQKGTEIPLKDGSVHKITESELKQCIDSISEKDAQNLRTDKEALRKTVDKCYHDIAKKTPNADPVGVDKNAKAFSAKTIEMNDDIGAGKLTPRGNPPAPAAQPGIKP